MRSAIGVGLVAAVVGPAIWLKGEVGRPAEPQTRLFVGVASVERLDDSDGHVRVIFAVLGDRTIVQSLAPSLVAAIGQQPSDWLRAGISDRGESWFVDELPPPDQRVNPVHPLGHIVIDDGDRIVVLQSTLIALKDAIKADRIQIRWTQDSLLLDEKASAVTVRFTSPDGFLPITDVRGSTR